MTSDRWKLVSHLYHRARERSELERRALLDVECGDDLELRREIESLLAQDGANNGFLETPAIDIAASIMSADDHSVLVGQRLGPYQISGLLGAGGMGDVYRAHDARLGRDVAIKVLPTAATGPERLARFEREARALAALNHPNIAAIHSIESVGSVTALVLELVPGETLYERLIRGPLPLVEAVDYARHIVEGLCAAHERGIVHRDLKPSNIKIPPNGFPKILDFGLAKAMRDAHSASTRESSTIGVEGTREGTILGTAAYMSPEQARGLEVDKRTDIWSFGCVLYEMLVGHRAFDGIDMATVIAQVIERDPDFDRLPPNTPPAIRTLLRRCLEKEPKRRLADIADARFDLDRSTAGDLDASHAAATGGDRPMRSRERIAWIAAAICLVSSVTMATLASRRELPVADVVRFSVAPPPPAVLITSRVGGGGLMVPAVSPDGRRMVFPVRRAGQTQLWVRSLDALDSRPLDGTEGSSGPFWSPDSRKIGFLQQGALKTIDAAGGPVQTICDISGPGVRGGWNRDGTIVFGSFSGGIFKVPAEGGQPVQITTPNAARGETAHRHPTFLPDGTRFAYIAWPTRTLWIGSVDGTEPTRLIEADSQAEFTNDHILFVRDGTLLAQRFVQHDSAPTGEPIRVAEQVLSDDIGFSAFSASRRGVLAYRSGISASMTRLVWVDRNGRAEGSVVEESGLYRNPALSPDGSRLAIERVDAIRGTSDIWLIDVAQKTMQRLTFDGASEVHPAWFPDGKRIYFASNRQKGSFDAHDGHRINPRGLYSVATDGPGAENLVLESNNDGLRPAQVSPDRRYLLYEKAAGLTITLNVLPLAEKGSSALDLDLGNLAGSRAQISPDGRWIAYVSVESGRNEVLIEGFANKRLKRQISIDGGVDPRWRGDGKELFYYSSSGALMAVPITSDETLTVGRAVPLFSPDLVNGPHSSLDVYLGRAQYDVSRDGQRFLLNVPAHAQDFERPSPSVTVMLNWMRE